MLPCSILGGELGCLSAGVILYSGFCFLVRFEEAMKVGFVAGADDLESTSQAVAATISRA